MQDSSWKFKEEVAETAISLFKRDGYNNVTVNEICKACGISRSVFYSSFNGKRSILEYMVQKPQHNDDASFSLPATAHTSSSTRHRPGTGNAAP